MKKAYIAIIALTAVLLVAGVTAFKKHYDAGGTEKQASSSYTCPMHPQIISDSPGDCPICGMKLVPVKTEIKQVPSAVGGKEGQATTYTCPMHPQIISDSPGDCPICGMKLVPLKTAESNKPINQGDVSDRAPFNIQADTAKVIGLTFATAEKRNLSREVKTSMRIVPDETRLYRVTTKIGGWVEKLHINQSGQKVSLGQPLLDIYSQELFTAQEEYLSAIRSRDAYAKNGDQALQKSIEAVVSAGRDRLKLLDVTGEQLARLEKSGKAERTVTVFAPAGGFVSDKSILVGQKINPGDSLMVIADLSRIWGEADIYQSDLQFIKLGMPVSVVLPFWPGRTFRGIVTFLNPFLNPQTRTLKARVELDNSDGSLKPEMFATATLTYQAGKVVTIPEGAVMRGGNKDYVFMSTGNTVTPREVSLGIRGSDGSYQVLSGLKDGEKVVASANFLIDSESALKSAFQNAR